ncbi:hypothetical protein T492DRAFT_897770 [Pavlovales sp. CCMP2436]|nr:hypothetical protein T492DRAFT_897770 [Pavlovales sp. CCMP2436]
MASPGETERAPPSLAWPLFATFTYFVAAVLTIPAMPSFANSIANGGSTAVSPAEVDLKGTFESIDQLVTFIVTPLWDFSAPGENNVVRFGLLGFAVCMLGMALSPRAPVSQ